MDELMSLAWGPGGLLASTQSVPFRLNEDGVPEALLTRTETEVAAFPLAVSAKRFAYARASSVYVFDQRGDYTQWFGAPDEDPAALSVMLASKALKKVDQKKVRLSGKHLTVFPDALLQATQLEVLELEHNCFTSLPDDLSRWTSLRSLNLHMNCVSQLPPSFKTLTALEHLDLGMNTCLQTLKVRGARPLREVPEQLRSLKRLKHLVLTMNELSDLPDWLAELPLETLDISSNRFARVPPVVAKLTHLKHLSLGQQPWTSGVTAFPPLFPVDGYRPLDDLDLVCGLTALESLAIDRLDLRALPQDLGNLRQLKALHLGFNERLTTLPNSFFSLQALTSLTAAYVKFTAATLAKLKARLPSCEVSSY